jgi:hypothetical protein
MMTAEADVDSVTCSIVKDSGLASLLNSEVVNGEKANMKPALPDTVGLVEQALLNNRARGCCCVSEPPMAFLIIVGLYSLQFVAYFVLYYAVRSLWYVLTCRGCPALPPFLSGPLSLGNTIPVIEVQDAPLRDTCTDNTTYSLHIKDMGWQFPMNFDGGIHWYTYGNRCSKGPSSPNFDPTKETVLYVHGWY